MLLGQTTLVAKGGGGWGGEEGLPYKKDWAACHTFIGVKNVKNVVLVHLGCQASKGSHQELLQYPLRY